MQEILEKIKNERKRQTEKWGIQRHPDGTGQKFDVEESQKIKNYVSLKESMGSVTWKDILLEEVYEVFAETSSDKITEELIQVAAVAIAWLEDLRQREGKSVRFSIGVDGTVMTSMENSSLLASSVDKISFPRLTDIEWEHNENLPEKGGWTVRLKNAAYVSLRKDPTTPTKYIVGEDPDGSNTVYFTTRTEALTHELEHFEEFLDAERNVQTILLNEA